MLAKVTAPLQILDAQARQCKVNVIRANVGSAETPSHQLDGLGAQRQAASCSCRDQARRVAYNEPTWPKSKLTVWSQWVLRHALQGEQEQEPGRCLKLEQKEHRHIGKGHQRKYVTVMASHQQTTRSCHISSSCEIAKAVTCSG